MQLNSNLQILFPSATDCDFSTLPSACEPFNDSIIEFLNDLSASILKDRQARAYPDVVTFAFFCRKANLLKLKELHSTGRLRLGRGTIFHIAPGNVPINFGYSLVCGLLSGNSNIVKLSSKEFPQIDLVIKHLKALEGYPASKRIVLVRYSHNSDFTARFSSMADIRVIWGGDNTIAEIRKNQLPPRSFDICFADRYSICALKAASILNLSDSELNKLAEGFYNDTFLFDQNACSAPHSVIWIGKEEEIKSAKKVFWESFYRYSKTKYQLQPVIAVNKLTSLYEMAIEAGATREETPDNLIVRAKVDTLPANIENYRCAGGFFTEYDAVSLDEITGIINRKMQTLCYFGLSENELQQFISLHKPTGIDRIVPIGETTSFSLIWDGYDLIGMMSRIVSII